MVFGRSAPAQALQDAGGWANRDTTRLFADYAEVVATRLGDRVKHWITHNEPEVVAFNGHYWGAHAPGIKDLGTAYQVSHHLLLSHGLATQVLEQAGLVIRGHQAQYRPCALYAAPLREVSTWAEQYRPVWESRFDQMENYLVQLRARTKDERTR